MPAPAATAVPKTLNFSRVLWDRHGLAPWYSNEEHQSITSEQLVAHLIPCRPEFASWGAAPFTGQRLALPDSCAVTPQRAHPWVSLFSDTWQMPLGCFGLKVLHRPLIWGPPCPMPEVTLRLRGIPKWGWSGLTLKVGGNYRNIFLSNCFPILKKLTLAPSRMFKDFTKRLCDRVREASISLS